MKIADLSVIRVVADNGDSPLRLVSDKPETSGDAIVRTLAFEFVAPEGEGPFAFDIQIPGLESLKSIMLTQKTQETK